MFFFYKMPCYSYSLIEKENNKKRWLNMDGSQNINNKAIESPIVPLASENISKKGDIKVEVES